MRNPGVIFRCPGHSIQDPATGPVLPPFGTFIVTRDSLIYDVSGTRHAWPLRDVEGFRSEVTPGTTTARLAGGPTVLISVMKPKALPKLQRAIRLATLAQS